MSARIVLGEGHVQSRSQEGSTSAYFFRDGLRYSIEFLMNGRATTVNVSRAVFVEMARARAGRLVFEVTEEYERTDKDRIVELEKRVAELEART